MLSPAPEREAGQPQTAPHSAPDHWHSVLGSLVDDRAPLLVRIALAHADGDGPGAVRWRPLHAARYDSELDEIELSVAVERGATLRYLVSRPRRVVVEEHPGQRVLRVYDASGLETVIRVCELSNVECARGRGKTTQADG